MDLRDSAWGMTQSCSEDQQQNYVAKLKAKTRALLQGRVLSIVLKDVSQSCRVKSTELLCPLCIYVDNNVQMCVIDINTQYYRFGRVQGDIHQTILVLRLSIYYF